MAYEIEDLRALFTLYDLDGSGQLDREELSRALSDVGASPMSDDELDETMDAMDLDGDGSITFEEFVAVLTARQRS